MNVKPDFRNFLFYTAIGTFIYAVCAGFRDNYGIMLPYIVGENRLSYDSTSLIIAIGQLFFGIMQPVFGYIAFRKSARYALVWGVALMLSGLLLIPRSSSWAMLALSLGVLLPSGTAAASFGILVSCVGPHLPEQKRPVSAGVIGGGIGFGICILSPILQGSLASLGVTRTIYSLAVLVFFLLPAALLLTKGSIPNKKNAANKEPIGAILHNAVTSRDYLLVAFAFFTCGFHMALIQTHLFSQLTTFGISEKMAAWALSIYGIGVIGGSVGSGMASSRWAMSKILAIIMFSRCLWIIPLLVPVHPAILGMDILMLGLSGVATLTPVAGIVQRLFGAALMPTLFGAIYLLHQVAAFCSAWLGGICMELTHDYSFVWYVDWVFCLLAGFACLAIRCCRKNA